MLKLIWLCVVVGLVVFAVEHQAPPLPPIATPALANESDESAGPSKNEINAASARLSDEFPSYENTVGDAARKIGLAHVYLICGLRNAEWYQETTLRLEQQLQLDIEALSQGEESKARRYASRQAQMAEEMMLGHRDRAGCPEFREMPFTQSDSAVDP